MVGSLAQQTRWLVYRNVVLKARTKIATVQEIFWPVYFVLMLGALRAGLQPKTEPAIAEFPSMELQTFSALDPNFPLAVAPNDTGIQELMDSVTSHLHLQKTRTFQYVMYETEDDMVDAYTKDTNLFRTGIVFSEDPTADMNYTIRMPYETLPLNSELFAGLGVCYDQQGLCPANQYLWSGFTLLQSTIDYVLMSMKNPNSTAPMPSLSVQMMGKNEYQSSTLVLQTLSAVYFVFAFAPFVGFCMVFIVYEKEKKITEGMKMMGMNHLAHWLAWVITYALLLLGTCIMCALIAWGLGVFPNSNPFLIFLMLYLYGLSLITAAFMLSPFFDKALTAGGVGSLLSLVISLLYLPTALTTVPVAVQWVLGLLSPFTVALAINQVTLLEAGYGQNGVQFYNMHLGEFPFSWCLIMLAVDIVLYQILAIYFDNVVPGPYGLRKPLLFCLMPSYWKCGTKYHQVSSGAGTYTTTTESHAHSYPAVASPLNGSTEITPINGGQADVEPVSSQTRSRVGISISNLVKVFKGGKSGKPVRAVDGISLDIFEGEITCLLGHNGAGKTTLINALTGMTPPTSGGARIYGYDVTDANDMNQIRTITGVCPQQDIVLDALTPREHLKVFAGLKGIENDRLEEEVEKVLRDVNLDKCASTPAQKLSGGQKRKLCVGMALIGDPKVLFLDEPSSGMDPYSRRRLWALLKNNREGRVIVLSTHFMDEADILADRKAIISKGTLRCYGSSLFLKNRFGIGYHLGMVIQQGSDVSQITDFVKSQVPSAELGRSYGMELTYTLPLQDVTAFADLFSALDATNDSTGLTTSKSFGIQSYGVSMTTLEEVFLKLGEEQEVDVEEGEGEEDYLINRTQIGTSGRQLGSDEDTGGMGYDNQAVSRESLSATVTERDQDDTSAVVVVKAGALDCKQIAQREMEAGQNQISALAMVRIAMRNSKAYFIRIIMPSIFMIIGIVLVKFISSPSTDPANYAPLVLRPDLYIAKPAAELTPEKTQLLYKNSTDDDLSTLLSQFDRLEFQYKADNLSDLLDKQPNHLGVNVYNWSQGFQSHFNALYNDTAQHSLPIIVSILTNALYGAVSGDDNNITVSSQPFPRTSESPTFTMGLLFAYFFAMALTGVGTGFAVDLVKDREIKAKSQLRISGLRLTNYWLTSFLIDLAQYCIPAVIGIILLLAFQVESFMQAGAMFSLLLLLIIWLPTHTIFFYCLSFIFDKSVTCETLLPWIGNIGLVLFAAPVVALDLIGYPTIAGILNIVFSFIFPSYAIFGGLYYIDRVYIQALFREGVDSIEFEDYFKPESYIFPVYISLLGAFTVFILLMRMLESRSLGSPVADSFRCGKPTQVSMKPNEDVIEDEDDDVQHERERVSAFDSSSVSNQDSQTAVLIKGLRKTFAEAKSKKSGKGGKKGKGKGGNTKIAVRNFSLCVPRGEVFGLLGPNGAGKTTTINMVTADISPDCGKVAVGSYDITSPLSDAFQMVGFCPQIDPLWEDLTTREHLETYAAIKGIHPKDQGDIATYFMKCLKIFKHADKKAKELSGGTKRKLCFCISMLGEPDIVLLDEPSTGMDPGAKRFLWDTVTASFVGDRGAILTTHSMEEADAVCSRVGIMTQGQLRCIGSTQHLKDKYGGGYLLEAKLKIQSDVYSGGDHDVELPERVSALEEFVMKLFPSAQVVEKFCERILYKIPNDNVSSLAVVFGELEKGKAALNIEEYSFSQSTLEQVFIDFAKKQEEEENDQGDLEPPRGSEQV